LKPTVKNNDIIQQIFEVTSHNFDDLCLFTFQFQYQNNSIYNSYCKSLSITPDNVTNIEQIPFLPISLFKTHSIKTIDFTEEALFESSGTTGSINSKHFVKSVAIYEQSFLQIFKQFYAEPQNWCILGLLPSYLERQNSSLVYMVNHLIALSQNKASGFYLNNIDALFETITQNEKAKQPTLIFGVTYALLDFAEKFSTPLQYTTIIETGGMKGRREELTREEVHTQLKNAFGLNAIHSEYGMTELLSQAYALKDGIFTCPNWMKIIIREEDDPFALQTKVSKPTTGLINVIDLANIYSCSFIATDDVGKLYNDDSFEVLGRKDNSDIRGCSLMTI
jgi:phenylacetate-coenzyme A ligase PaaK-like adenylate-forming protein